MSLKLPAGMTEGRSPAADPGATEENRSRRAPRGFTGFAAMLLALYAVFIAANMSVVAGGSDSSGYLNSARLLAAGRLHGELRLPPGFASQPDVSPRHFAPMGFNVFPGTSQPAPTYPTGLPLHFAAAGSLLGWHAGPFLIQLLAAVGAVGLCYACARELEVDPLLAAAGAAMLAVFPVFIFTSIQTLSDTIATTWTLAAVYAGLRGRTSLGWLVAGGAAFAMAVLVRPTNLLLAPGLAVLIGFTPLRLAYFTLGGLPGAVWMAFYNHQLYGGALKSGYGNIFDTFALEYGAPTAAHFAKWLALFLPAPVLLLPFAALMRRDTRRREWLALALMSAGIIGVYLFYSVSQDVWWCLRFILPAVATVILLALLGAKALLRAAPRSARPMGALILALWAVGNACYWTRELSVLHVPKHERTYLKASRLAAARIPRDALVLTLHFTGSLHFYTSLASVMYEGPTTEELARYVQIARSGGNTVWAVLFEFEEEPFMRGRHPGNWRRIDGVDNVGLWQLE